MLSGDLKFTDNYLIKSPPTTYMGYIENITKNNLMNKFSNISLKKLVPHSKICVCSYLGSTFFELMANDIPFITFFRYSENCFSEEFSSYIKKLKKFNFLFYNGTSAAKFLNENHNNFYELWDDTEFLNFRKEFKSKWCKKEKNWQDIFIKNI